MQLEELLQFVEMPYFFIRHMLSENDEMQPGEMPHSLYTRV